MASVLDTLGSVKAPGKHMLYISESDSLMDICTTPGELTRKAVDLGVDIYPVDLANVKKDLMLIGV
jgi:hypothetical protein